MHIIASVLAILPTSGTQKNFAVRSWNYKPPVTTYLDHQEYSATTERLDVDRTSPISSDVAEITMVIEGFTADFMSTFVNGATPVAGTARIWGISQADAANTVRVLSDEFSMFADLDGAIDFQPTGWASATIKLRVNGAKPQFTLDGATTP